MRHFALALAFFLIAGCDDHEPAELTLAQLVAQQTTYSGRSVVVAGTLRSHPEPLHYWIEDDNDNRVELDYADDLAPMLGKRIAVRGRFLYDPESGRSIAVEYLSPSP
jgi:hypothetical protein